MIPDHLPEVLKQAIAQFPPGSLQFEIGIQSFNPEVQRNISRKQNNEKSIENLRWLVEHSHAHIHADLIVGLPGEDLDSFAKGFDRLAQLGVHEIQVGILKRLRGSPIIRHTDAFGMIYNPYPPYDLLQNNLLPFEIMQNMKRFARFWDMIANAGRFQETLPLILANQPFVHFSQLSEALYREEKRAHGIQLRRLFQLIARVSDALFPDRSDQIVNALDRDWSHTQEKGMWRKTTKGKHKSAAPNKRQRRHVSPPA